MESLPAEPWAAESLSAEPLSAEPLAADSLLGGRLQHEQGAWLCTLRPDGSPHVTPVWFVHLEGCWWIGSRATNVKVRNVQADPRVVLTLESIDEPVVAEGRAQVAQADEFPEAVVEAFQIKYGWNPATVDGSEAPRVLLRVVTGRWLMAVAPG
ncbi:pyridoxamine 5'-phosphate oxidase family protein [Kineosporia mesophila]|uniref:pyridoxamine 5'-phosphate oxidase family protein n=1 Tax=Kineosporia mesophila TaxID=566012 RepID=UPI001E29320B|nr:pyridoxamine 5'-phosphate oxidase family protein [Kineosporia mesophila]